MRLLMAEPKFSIDARVRGRWVRNAGAEHEGDARTCAFMLSYDYRHTRAVRLGPGRTRKVVVAYRDGAPYRYVND